MRIQKNCENCGKEFTTRTSETKRGYGKFCSRLCGNPSRGKSGEQNANWRGGRFKSNGYIYIRHNGGYRGEHDLIIEKHIGRSLTPGEEVHHINGIKDDNRLENLELTTKSEHAKLHSYTRSRNEYGDFN